MRAHPDREMSAQKETWSAHKFWFKMFLYIFYTCRSKYRCVLVKYSTQEIVCKHRLNKLQGTLFIGYVYGAGS